MERALKRLLDLVATAGLRDERLYTGKVGSQHGHLQHALKRRDKRQPSFRVRVINVLILVFANQTLLLESYLHFCKLDNWSTT